MRGEGGGRGGGISEARKAELQAKIDNRDALKERLEKQREEMEKLEAKIEEAEAQQMSSFSAASKGFSYTSLPSSSGSSIPSSRNSARYNLVSRILSSAMTR